MQIDPMNPGPTEVVGNPFGTDLLGQALQTCEMCHVKFGGRGNGKRDPVHDYGEAFCDLAEDVAWLAARLHIVFGDNLEPIDARLPLKNVFVVFGPQPEAKSEIGWMVRGSCHNTS